MQDDKKSTHHKKQEPMDSTKEKKITEPDQILDCEMENWSQATSDKHEVLWRAGLARISVGGHRQFGKPPWNFRYPWPPNPTKTNNLQ
jgi:hypothetical protein